MSDLADAITFDAAVRSGLPYLSIALVTYKRTEEALRTIRGISENLSYPKPLRLWFVGDDGSGSAHVNALVDELKQRRENLANYHCQRSSPNVGRGWNRVLNMAFRYSDFVLWLEDDWVLTRPFDIRPYVRMLMTNDQVGLVRLGHLAVGSDVHIVGYDGIHYLQYQKTTQYAYSGNPQIRHRRFVDAYGRYSEEEMNPGDLELDYDSRFRNNPGPAIWRPADIPGWGVFAHIGKEKTW